MASGVVVDVQLSAAAVAGGHQPIGAVLGWRDLLLAFFSILLADGLADPAERAVVVGRAVHVAAAAGRGGHARPAAVGRLRVPPEG